MPNPLIVWADDEFAETENAARRQEKGLRYELERFHGVKADVLIVRNAMDALLHASRDRMPSVVIMDLDFDGTKRRKRGRAQVRGEDAIEHMARQMPAIPIVVYSQHVTTGSAGFEGLPNVRAVVRKLDYETLRSRVAQLIKRAPPVIVHMSDIHFGAQHGFTKRYSYSTLQETFALEVRDYIKPARPNVVVISGDFTTRATHDEFRDARRFVEWLRVELDLAPEAVCFVPGNHDVSLGDPFAYQNYWTDLCAKVHGSSPVVGGYINPASPDDAPNQTNLLWARAPEGVDALLVGLASTMVSDLHPIKGFDTGTLAAIGGDQLERLRGVLDQAPERSVKVAVMHHHVFPVPTTMPAEHSTGDDDSVVHGQPVLLSWLAETGIDVVLHGHTHYPSFRTVQTHFSGSVPNANPRPVHVIAAGTIGASTLQRAAPYHHYYLLRFDETEGGRVLGIESRVRHSDHVGWTTSPELSATVAIGTGSTAPSSRRPRRPT